jgi:AraC family transcriptional regulator
MINLINKEPRIPITAARKLIGKKMSMSFSDNKTVQLWRRFMPHRNEIENNMNGELYSVQVYKPGFFENFKPHKTFIKWAGIEVTDFNLIPNGMEKLELPGGLYAVFSYRGKASDASDTFKYIYYEWLPASEYFLDDRPHFEILGEKYKNEHPDSEEEIWIPVKLKDN